MIQKIKNFAIFIWHKVTSGDLTDTTALQSKIIKTIRLLTASAQQFMKDEALLRAASISYSLIISFVPSMIVVLLVGARVINTDEYFELAKEFVRKNGIPFDLDPYITIIKELIQNAGTIGGIGLLILMFSATSVLRNLENALNRIWRVTINRPIVQKISGFLMVMIFGPLLLTIGMTYASWLLGKFASPDLVTIRDIGNESAILGNKAVYLTKENNRWKYKNLIKKIDFSYNNKVIIYNTEESAIITGKKLKVHKSRVEKASKNALSRAIYTDIATNKEEIYITTSDGTLLRSWDNGQNFYVTRFQREQSGWLFNVKLNRIKILEDGSLLIAGSNGTLLRSDDRAETWMVVPVGEKEVDFKAMATNQQGRIYIVGTNFTIFFSDDGGLTFDRYSMDAFEKINEKATLNDMKFIGNEGFIVGDFGTILSTNDGGENWLVKDIARSYDFRSIYIAGKGNAIAVGDQGAIRQGIMDASGKWSWHACAYSGDIDLHGVGYDATTDKVIIVGDKYNILSSKITREKMLTQKGETLEFEVIQQSPFWRKLISALGNVILPFSAIWLLFFLVYLTIPYTDVKTGSAALGAAVTSTVWVVFLLGFKIYLSSFSKGTFAIYGTLAAIPLTLMMVYISCLIMLFGAEVAFLHQYPGMMKIGAKRFSSERKRALWSGFSVLFSLAQSFYHGKGSIKEATLVRLCNNDREEFDYLCSQFTEKGLIEKCEGSSWILSSDPAIIKIENVIKIIEPTDYYVPHKAEKGHYVHKTSDIFEKILQARHSILKETTLADLMNAKKK